MSTDKLIVKLRYSKNQREAIGKIANMESTVSQEDITESQPSRDDKKNVPSTKLPMVERLLSRIRRVLRHRDCDASESREVISLLKETLRYLTDSFDTEEGAGDSSGQQRWSTKDKDGRKDIESPGKYKDPQLTIASLTADNKRLEAANNELICDIDKNEAELSELREEVGRIRDKESRLEDISNSLESSRNSMDKALNALTSLKKKENTRRENLFALKKELNACQAERDEALTNLERQTESFEDEHKTFVDENTKLKRRMASLKRTLDDVDDLEHDTSRKKR